MRSYLKAVGALLVVSFGSVQGYLKSYEVTPTRANWSAWTARDGGVGQTIVCNFDSAVEVHLFVGYLGASPSTPFKADIYEQSSGDWIAYNEGEQALQDHCWLRMPLTTRPGQKFVRGKQYLVKFTRPGDSIQFYYDPNNPYHYGQIEIGGGGFQPPPQPVEYCDLCMRCYGVMEAENLGACKTPATV